ncbi:MAG: 1-deoxy-D-xylulose-5-phosphate synthase, partial [Ruminiclostridium sp.]|nr:1-deoxy-D-xylulose-5-phosphate synthase [Ruminiclostridium sp.]
KRVFFFEEGIRSGGVAEKFMCRLYERGFTGKYSITAPTAPAPCADVESQLADAGLDRESMIKAVKGL